MSQRRHFYSNIAEREIMARFVEIATCFQKWREIEPSEKRPNNRDDEDGQRRTRR